MSREEFYDYIYDRIENCASLEYVVDEVDKNKEVLDTNDVIKIIRYWESFSDMII